ncbi:MAG: galactokinase [Actinobacteria bacterium]|nr:galactokinase [Actinomycetota bacterium]
MNVHVFAPGRVNLIGEHTDYTGGLVMPMAIDRYTEIEGTRGGARVQLTSFDEPDPVDLPLTVDDPQHAEPAWAKYVAGVVAEMAPAEGFVGRVSTDIPIGAGLSSSHALQVAVALALGHQGSAIDIAQLTQRAENRSSGVPTGIMDQLAIAAGVKGHALVIDCGDLTIEPVPVPDDLEVVVLFVAHRTLVGSAYADRVAECRAVEQLIGPLRDATPEQARALEDPVLRMRALHVTTENQRVRDFADALRNGDLVSAGRLMVEGHESLRLLYDTSTPVMNQAVTELCATPGVYGARMTGGGFGGCVVALTEPGALARGWVVQAVDGARAVVS